MPLTDAAIRQAKPADKPTRLYDAGGLYLEVSPAGGKLWRLKYRFGGKEKRLALGAYPDVGLKQARERRDESRKLLAGGIDPSAQKKVERETAADIFETIAREWHEHVAPTVTAKQATMIMESLEKDVFPHIGARPIRDITAPELLAVIKRIEARGAKETARRTLQRCARVCKYAVASGRADLDASSGLIGALAPVPKKKFAALTEPKQVAELLRAIDAFAGTFVVACALRLAPLVFVRPGELRHAEWSEFDLDTAEWRIPEARMKMKEKHIVPLSRQAVEVLRELHALTGDGRYVFPSVRTSARPMSENTLNAALRRLGFDKTEMTSHGFRAMASTLLNEMGFNRDAIERQLAHGERNKIRASYNFAEFLPERRKMMQAWGDYLDGLKAGAKVTPIRTARGNS